MAMTKSPEDLQTNLDTRISEKVNDISENVRKVFQTVLPQILRGLNLSGSGVNHLRELGWETGTIEQQFRDRFQQIGRRVSNIQLPPVVNTWIESGKSYAAENPLTAMTILALSLSCAIPVVVFLTFAFITLLVTFTGFLFVEGTILGIAAVFLGGALLIIGGVTLAVVSFLLVSYFIATKIYTLVTGDTNPHRFLRKIPYVGHFFANMDHTGVNGDAPKIQNGYEGDSAAEENLANTD